MSAGKIDVDALLKEVRENLSKLNKCPGPHDFQVHEKYESGFVKKLQCSNCKGVVGMGERLWYERGLAHGSRVTFFETREAVQIVELSTRRYHIKGEKLIELHLHGPSKEEWVPSSREWFLKDIIIKDTLPITD